MKVLVNVYVPAINEKLDVLVPDWLSVAEVVSLLVKNVQFVSNNRYIATGQEQLCKKETNTVFHPSCCFFEYLPKNGDEFVLI